MNIINVRKLITIDVHKPNLGNAHFGIAELSVFSDDDRITMFGSKSDTAPWMFGEPNVLLPGVDALSFQVTERSVLLVKTSVQ